MKHETKGKLAYATWWIVVGYVALAGLVYMFRHPEMTDTQRFLNFFDAMMWR
jgi:hypothetical protein